MISQLSSVHKFDALVNRSFKFNLLLKNTPNLFLILILWWVLWENKLPSSDIKNTRKQDPTRSFKTNNLISFQMFFSKCFFKKMQSYNQFKTWLFNYKNYRIWKCLKIKKMTKRWLSRYKVELFIFRSNVSRNIYIKIDNTPRGKWRIGI